MKKRIAGNRKAVLLALFLAAAGCFHGCGAGGEEIVLAEAETQEAAETVPSAEETAQSAGTFETTGAAAQETLCVHVCGEVAQPGVYRLPEGSRVYEAVELAGGFTEQAEQDFVNLAEPLSDGMKIEIPDREQAGELAASGRTAVSDGASGTASAKVNINRADRETLMTLNGIGEARAEAILRYRQEHGNFGSIEDIMLVPGIKDAAFRKIRDSITV